jgi:hypothetical protein
MDNKCDNVCGEEDLSNPNIPDDVLERAAGTVDIAALTFNFCTYNYYQCGPIAPSTLTD